MMRALVRAVPFALLAASQVVVPPPARPAAAGEAAAGEAPRSPLAPVAPLSAPELWQVGRQPTLAQLEALAIERSAALAADRLRLEAARQRIAPAGALPGPMAELVLVNAGFPELTVGEDDMSLLGVEARQALPLPAKREARRNAARAALVIAEVEHEATRRRLLSEVRGIYGRLYALDRARYTLILGHDLLKLVGATALARYGAGAEDQAAVIAARLEVAHHDARMEDTIAERRARVAELFGLLDITGENWLPEISALPALEPPPQPWEPHAERRAPDILRAAARLTAAERELELARLGLRPDLSAGAGVGWRDEFDPVVTLRLGVELPLWPARQRELIGAAERERDAAAEDLRGARARARADAQRLAAAWDAVEVHLERYREVVLPESSASFDAARAAFLDGRADFAMVSRGFESWLEARLEEGMQAGGRFALAAEIMALLGAEPVGKAEETVP